MRLEVAGLTYTYRVVSSKPATFVGCSFCDLASVDSRGIAVCTVPKDYLKSCSEYNPRGYYTEDNCGA